MKIIVFGMLLLLAIGGQSAASEIAYTYLIIDRERPQDLNVKGDLLSEAINPDGSFNIILEVAKGKTKLFDNIRCSGLFNGRDGSATRINNPGDIGGSCFNPASSKQEAFIRRKNGTFDFIGFPGADQTELRAISDNRKVCGQYVNPFIHPLDSGFTRFHGFCADQQDRFQTLDVPLLGHAVTIITGVNKTKKIGNYFQFDPVTNETGQWHCFQIDNDNYTSLERPGAVFSFCSDLNNDDVVLYEDDQDVFILDDGIYFKISDPTPAPGFRLLQVDVNGFDDDLRIVGNYRQIPIDCEFFACPGLIKTVNFIATPR